MSGPFSEEAMTAVTPPTTAPTLEDACNRQRAQLLEVEIDARAIAEKLFSDGKKEAGAQAMLAVRHIEDARMRIGKVIQHGSQGGVSVFDAMKRCQADGCRTVMSMGTSRFCPDHNSLNP